MKCVICGKEITTESLVDMWGNHVCKRHHVKTCFSCYRIIGRYSTYSKLSHQVGFQIKDGRCVCGLCQETSVIKQEQIDESTQFVVKLLAAAGFKINMTNVTIRVINKEDMTKIAPSAEGLCCAKINTDFPEESIADIFILHAMPAIKFQSVLGHELLHHWIHCNGIKDGDSIEGFCNIGEALVLNYYVSKQGNDLAEILRATANNNQDYYYGFKFLEQKAKLKNMGWKDYINEILRKKKIEP